MQLSYVGHACFLVQSNDGRRVLIDPYRSGALDGRIRHAPVELDADVVCVTHYHEDHGWVGSVGGDPDIVDCSRTAAGIRFKTITVPHDCHDGSYMGLSRMIQFSVDGVRVLHPGDLGRLPNDAELEALGRIDLLFLPIGGKYTIGVDAAITLYRQLRPRWAVPMHYRSDCVDLDMAARDDFVQALNSDDRVHEVGGPQWVCSAADRLEPSEILLLDPARGPFSL